MRGIPGTVRVQIPDRTMDALRAMFPTLDFARIRVHAGIPLRLRGLQGLILPSLWSQIHVYLDDYRPDAPATLAVLAHELVHAAQMQSLRTRGYLNTWILSYLFCWLVSGSSLGGSGNSYEAEAYAFEREALRRMAPRNRSGGAGDWVTVEVAPQLLAAVSHGPEALIMRQPRARACFCYARMVRNVPTVGFVLAVSWIPLAALVAAAGWLVYTLADLVARTVTVR